MSEWKSMPFYGIAKPKQVVNCTERELLSIYLGKGVVPFSSQTAKRTNVTSTDLSKYQAVDYGDFVLNNQQAWRGSVGVSKYCGIISPAYIVLALSNDILTDFANYLFQSRSMVDKYVVCSKGVGSIQRNIYWDYLKRINLFLPPRTEQDQIVRFLDWKVSLINRLINAKKKQIGLLQEQKRAVINEAVTRGGEGWRDISLGNLGDFRKGFGGSRADDAENGVACIRYGDIYRSGVLSLTNPITRISKEASISYARVYKSEVLFALSGETKEEIGQALINNIDEDTWCSGDAAIFTANNEVLPHFLIYALRCPYIVAQRASLAKGDIIVHISTSALRQLRVIVPPISEQETIIADLDKKCDFIERAVEIENNQISLLHEYRTRLISDVVTGKKDVRGVEVPQYEAAEEAVEDEPIVINEDEMDE